jgi:hypothetical protein
MIPGYRVGATALAAMMVIASGAEARQVAPAAKCAGPDEVSSIQTAAIQQQLMVAALTCNEIARFNSFQTSFGSELRASDATLSKMFKRIFGAKQGEAEYHAFKTRLANDSSIRSIHDNVNYCRQAGALLTTALLPQKPALVSFASVVQVVEESPVNSCELRVAMSPAAANAPSATPNSTIAAAPPVAPQPRPEAAAAMSASTTSPGQATQQ